MPTSATTYRILSGLALAAAMASASLPLGAQGPAKTAGAAHPDLSGTWLAAQILPINSLKRQDNGKVTTAAIDRSAYRPANGDVAGALPFTAAPSYKPEFQAKVKDLIDHESKTDPVFFCGKPGTPRIGPPRRIVQLPNEVIFLYEDVSGDPYRVIPTDGRPHDPNLEPSAYGNSVGTWRGNTLVVDVTNFTDDTWFGEKGYFHTRAMHVIERYWRVGENLAYQVTVEDPNVLTAPWTAPPRLVKPSSLPLEESPPCKDQDSPLLLNNDHHDQR